MTCIIQTVFMILQKKKKKKHSCFSINLYQEKCILKEKGKFVRNIRGKNGGG